MKRIIDTMLILWVRHKTTLIVVIILLVSGLVFGAVRHRQRAPAIPTFTVERGEFIDSTHLRGEVKALKSVTISAPPEAGELRILTIASEGTHVKQGDTIVEFDKTKTEQDLAQYESSLRFTQADIEQARAQARLTEEKDVTAVMKARFDVESAKLDASKQEIVSEIEGGEAKLKVADAEQKLREAEAKLTFDREGAQATINNKVEANKKAAFDVQRAQLALSRMTLRAPAAGVISLATILRPENEAPFKPGDQVWPGAPIAELPDASTLSVSARVDEIERGRLAVKQPVTVQLDAIPDRQFTGTLAQISALATEDFTGGWPIPRNFDLLITVDQADERLKPGMTAQITVILDRVPNALAIPVQASFEKDGEDTAYVWDGSRFSERKIEIGLRTEDRILVAGGLKPGDRVALKDPTVQQ
jgi:HlyD family secretion protein